MTTFKKAISITMHILIASGMLFFSFTGKSSPPDWTPTPNLQYNMNVIGKLQIDDGVFAMNPGDLIAAFVGDECRGIASPLIDFEGLLFITIGSNQLQGETISFQAYLADTGEIQHLNQTIVFENQLMIGNPADPFIFTFDPGTNSHLVLQNIFIGEGSTECFSAPETITLAGDDTQFVVNNGGTITLIAGESISFLPGTKIESGGVLHAYISDELCDYTAKKIDDQANLSALDFPASTKMDNPNIHFKVYPNPTKGSFIIELESEFQNKTIQIEVFGVFNNLIYRDVLPNQRLHYFNLSNKQAGVYVIRISAGNKTAFLRIVKH